VGEGEVTRKEEEKENELGLLLWWRDSLSNLTLSLCRREEEGEE